MLEKSYGLVGLFDVLQRLADLTAFEGGRKLALALRPSADASEVAVRLAQTREARDLLDRQRAGLVHGAADVRPAVAAAARGRVLSTDELLAIAATLGAAARSVKAVVREPGRWTHLAELLDGIGSSPALADAITGAIDEAGEVRDEASPALRKLRKANRAAHERILRQLESITRGEGRDLLQEALITQRAGRWVLPVKAEFRARLPGVVHDVSDSGATVFVEPMSVVELSNKAREGLEAEAREVERILRGLSQQVADASQEIRDTVEALSRLDLALSRGLLARQMGAVAPEIESQGPPGFRFDRARHPLLDPASAVPIDIRLGEGYRCLVITGPNTGGKTVSLKTAGLLVAMAQCGLQVPAAEGARLGVFDGVFADIGDEQSIEQSLSTFSGHMTNIVRILAEAGPSSLVLFDELGAGTDPAEGAALAGAILDRLRDRGTAVIASTHYTELKAYAWSMDGVANASVEFDITTLEPTYELTIGLPGRSNALAIAERLGLPEDVVEAARSGLQVSHVELEDMLSAIRDERAMATEERAAASEARREAEAWSAKLESALAEIAARRAEILAAAAEAAAAELEAARVEIEGLLRRAREIERSLEGAGEAAGATGLAEQLTADLEAASDRLSEAHQRSTAKGRSRDEQADDQAALLQPGCRVRVVSFGQVGELLWLDEREAEVGLGVMKLRVARDDIEYAGPGGIGDDDSGGPARVGEGRLRRLRAAGGGGAGRVSGSGSGSGPAHAIGATGRARGASPSLGGAAGAGSEPEVSGVEIDLRGMRVEEALMELDRRLDTALLSGAPWLHIIHGHGTGALKDAVRDALARNRAVVRRRPGERGEGGDGVTIAYFE